MKQSEIKVGGTYVAKVSNKLTTVRVDAIREEVDRYRGGNVIGTQTIYDVTNLKTGRHTTFRSAAKFRKPATIGCPEIVGTPDRIPPDYIDSGFNNRHED